jgi:hypothetical protein
MKSESFLHTSVMICNFVCKENHILFKWFCYQLSILGFKHLWSCWQVWSQHKIFSGRERKKKVWKFVMEQNANGDEILCGTKEKESWKNNASHICAWFKIIIILILFHHKMELAIVFVFRNTHYVVFHLARLNSLCM